MFLCFSNSYLSFEMFQALASPGSFSWSFWPLQTVLDTLTLSAIYTMCIILPLDLLNWFVILFIAAFYTMLRTP